MLCISIENVLQFAMKVLKLIGFDIVLSKSNCSFVQTKDLQHHTSPSKQNKTATTKQVDHVWLIWSRHDSYRLSSVLSASESCVAEFIDLVGKR